AACTIWKLFCRYVIGRTSRPKHGRAPDPDKRRIGIGNGELVHPPGFDFGMEPADDLVPEYDGQLINIRAVIVKRKRISARHQPAMLGLAQVQTAAITVMQDAVIVFIGKSRATILPANEAKTAVKGLGEIQVGTGYDRGECL